MNNKTNSKPSTKKAACPVFQGALSDRNCIAYRMRTECLLDADLVRSMLNPWLLAWSQQAADVDSRGEIHCPDVDVELKVKKSAPPLDVLRRLIDMLPDCHVAAQSLDHARTYTGNRIDHELIFQVQPPESLLASVAAGLSWMVKRLQHERKYLKRCSDDLKLPA